MTDVCLDICDGVFVSRRRKMNDISSEGKDFSEKIIIHGPDYEWWNLPHHHWLY